MTRVVVMAVPKRSANVAKILKMVPHAEVVWDQNNGKLPVAVSAWQNFIKLLERVGDDPYIHLEDDCILTSNFLEKAEAEIAKQPDQVLQFFSRRKDDIRLGSRWTSRFSCLVCFYCPPGAAAGILQIAKAAELKDYALQGMDFDKCVDDWLRQQKRRYWTVTPNLADHQEFRSAIDSRRPRARHSLTFKP